ncbi:MAG TPA: 50S ribosome-binding GTPase, partial [Aminobacteriaceae bacterium]|nr:50S ribosome-binding GTPase [Aminobacteriaceae bacterium]
MNNPFAGIGFRAGNVVLAGRPNVGKSSLVNRLLDYKVSIVSEKPQTTRNVIRCVYNGEDFQIIFSDTPGIHLPKHKLGRTLVDAAVESLEEADLICYVLGGDGSVLRLDDVTDKVAHEDEEILSVLGKVRTPVL